MTRPRRVPDAAQRRLRLLGHVLVLLGLLAGAAACADAGRSGAAAGHGLVLRANAPQSDVLEAVLRPDGPGPDALRSDALRSDGLPADGPPAGSQAYAPAGNGAPAVAPRPASCAEAHTPGAPAEDCPAASERAPATPLSSGPGPCPPPGAGPPFAAGTGAPAEAGVTASPPGARGTPDLHELQVQRT
ncbi:hypothetical protein ACXZ65_11045 [Streptomyces aculeolatus]